jgi:ribonuclease H / adenosylcobalamin/alpha-ribazole phosphatase
MNLIINTDGASRGNPGPASYGYVIKDKISGVILHQEGKVIGINTNNVAEYTAVLKAFEYAAKYFSKKAPHEIEIVTDSELIARQLAGFYKVKNANLKILFDKIKSIEIELGKVAYRNVPRAQNFMADKLANIALDNNLI